MRELLLRKHFKYVKTVKHGHPETFYSSEMHVILHDNILYST